MNEKIERLAVISGVLNYVDNETPRVYFVSGNADCENVEKFAELIIRECHNVVFKNTGPKSALNILEHFGIEE